MNTYGQLASKVLRTEDERYPSPGPARASGTSPARALVALAALLAIASVSAQGEPAKDLTSLSLEQLLQVTIVSAAKYEQKQSDVAAAASAITRQEIQAFRWRTQGAALANLPGVHTTYDRQYSYLGARGFGLPGDYNPRHSSTACWQRL